MVNPCTAPTEKKTVELDDGDSSQTARTVRESHVELIEFISSQVKYECHKTICGPFDSICHTHVARRPGSFYCSCKICIMKI